MFWNVVLKVLASRIDEGVLRGKRLELNLAIIIIIFFFF